MTHRDRLMLSTIVLILLVAGYWFLLLAPKRQAADDAAARVETARQAMQTAQQQLSSGQAAQELFRKQRATVVRLGRVVPASDDTATLLTQLTGIAKKHDIVFTSYTMMPANSGGEAPSGDSAAAASTASAGTSGSSTDAVAPLFPPGSQETSGGLGRTSLQIRIAGSYFDLERFVREVQRFAVLSAEGEAKSAKGRLFVVDGIKYTPMTSENGGPADAITAEMSASVYFAPPLEVPAAPAAGGAAPAEASSSASTPATIGGLK